jgi:RND family efflux transporter MFP subunit
MGFAGFIALKKMKKPPVMAEITERELPVRVVRVEPEKRDVIISGFGEIMSRSTVPLAVEVAGRITGVHDKLHVGGVMQKGEVLCSVNDEDYRLDLDSAATRLKSLTRDLELARKEFTRQSGLYKKNRVGTQSGVEKAEQAVNAITSQLSQVRQASEFAKLKLSRCVLRAPFTGRITRVDVERGEYVTPGKALLTIVDDTDLEIEVPLDSREAVNWLRFKPLQDSGSWFGLPEETACQITWTEKEEVQGTGRLDRVVRFDQKTRTLVVAVRLDAKTKTSVPLVQGMFCRVDITGKPLESVFVVPRQAVSFDNNVYVVEDNRLHTRKVTVARVQGDKAFIGKGLQKGDTVITTRLENPLENMLVRIVPEGETGK